MKCDLEIDSVFKQMKNEYTYILSHKLLN